MKTPRRIRKTAIHSEQLETRQLLTGGAGNTFAIVPLEINQAGAKAVAKFHTDSTLFTKVRGQITIGIDVAAKTNSTAIPTISGIADTTNKSAVPFSRSLYSPSLQRVHPEQGKLTTAVIATIRSRPGDTGPADYNVTITGKNQTTGQLLVGFYLPGDASGDGIVDKSDIQLINKAMGTTAQDTEYNFAYDSNRDGKITPADVRIATKNIGAKVNVSPVVSANLEAAFDSGLQDRVTNLRTVKFTGFTTPNATVTYDEASNKTSPVSTKADGKGDYSLEVTLADGSNSLRVTSVDAFGQNITGLIAPVTYSIHATPNLVAAAPTTKTATT